MIYISTPPIPVSSSITSSILLHCARIYRVSRWSTQQLTQITRRYHFHHKNTAQIICYETALSLSLSLVLYRLGRYYGKGTTKCWRPELLLLAFTKCNNKIRTHKRHKQQWLLGDILFTNKLRLCKHSSSYPSQALCPSKLLLLTPCESYTPSAQGLNGPTRTH